MAENLAKVVSEENIIKALEEIIETNPILNPSTKFDIVYKGWRFPPKEVVRKAAQIQEIENWPTYRLSGGESTNKHLRKKGFDIQPKAPTTKYYIGGAKWGGEEDYTTEFIEKGYWQNGHDARFVDQIKSVPVGSFIAIKSVWAARNGESYLRIKCVGEVTENPGDGKILIVNWEKPFEFFDIPGLSNYRETFYEITAPDEIDAIFNHDEKTMQPSDLSLTNLPIPTSLNTILYGPPGTGKTYNSIRIALRLLGDDLEGKDQDDITELFGRRMKEARIVFTTFHQSMSYEDFIEGIKPKTEDQKVIYEIEEGVFKLLCNKARPSTGNFDEVIEMFKKEISEADGKTPLTITAKATKFDVVYRGTNVFYVQPHSSVKDDPWYPVNILNIRKAFESGQYEGIYNPTYVREIIAHLISQKGLKKASGEEKNEPYVLIIDEINRGNIAQIFGELITLIEEGKRLGRPEELEVTLPYSKERFGVPTNIYILGTMNTADRSVEALDTALRRRFSFIEMPPLYNLEELNREVEGIHLAALLRIINKRIEKLLSKDNLIGHSYFISVKNLSDLKSIFHHNIIPLLQEYFYGDFGKVGLVLGKGFFENGGEQEENNDTLFADFADYSTAELLEKPVYKLMDVIKMTDPDFKSAIESLLNRKIAA